MNDTPTFASFNPTNNETVTVIKAKTDELIEIVRSAGMHSTPDASRRAAIAITNYEQAAMWAVKSLF